MGDRASAINFYNQGVAAAQDKTQPVHLQLAYQLFSSSAFVDSSYGQAWYGLGNANHDLKMNEAAVAAYRRCLQCDLDTDMRSRALGSMGWVLHQLGRTKEASAVLHEALRLDPKSCPGWVNLSCVHGTLGQPLLAVETARKAVECDPNEITAQMQLAFALLFNGDYQGGFREFEIRFKYKLHQFLQYPYPKWQGERDRTLFLVADQGLGDTLSFARFVPLAARRCKFIHMVVQPELMRLFTQAFIDLPNINIMPLSSPFLPADCWSTFVSLPFALGLTNEEIKTTPQIVPTAYPMSTSWKAPDAKVHIGIAWAGSDLNEINKWRSIPVTQFLELYRVPGVQLYSLQVGERSNDLQATGITALIRELTPYISDVTDTVSLLRDLDLVICCESALGHICALADKECWLPYSYMGKDYRLGYRAEQKLWTPKHRVFPQKANGDWTAVFEEIVEALKVKVRHG